MEIPRDWPDWTRRAVEAFAQAVHHGAADLDEVCDTLTNKGIPNSVRSWPIAPLPDDHPYHRVGNPEWAEMTWRRMILTARAGRITTAIHARVRELQNATDTAAARIEWAAYQAGMAGWTKERLRAEVLRLADGLITEDQAAEIAIPAALRGKRSAQWKVRRTA